jgi:integrase
MTYVLAWLEHHPDGVQRSPLFVSLRGPALGTRLSGEALIDVLTATCKRAGVRRYTPHALRHAAITHGLDATGGNLRQARDFSRHALLSTLSIYDDNRRDGGGEIAELLDPARELGAEH